MFNKVIGICETKMLILSRKFNYWFILVFIILFLSNGLIYSQNNTAELTVHKIVSTPHENTMILNVDITTSNQARVYILFDENATYKKSTNLTDLGTSHKITIIGNKADSEVFYKIIAFDIFNNYYISSVNSFTTGSVPTGIPDFKVTTFNDTKVYNGITIIGPGPMSSINVPNQPLYFGIDIEGNVIWYYMNQNDDTSSISRDFKAISSTESLISIKGGFRHIKNNGELINEYNGQDYGYSGFHHDVLLLPNKNFLTIAYVDKEIDTDNNGSFETVRGDELVEINPVTKSVIWTWSTFDHIDNTRYPTEMSKRPKNGVLDWTHCNGFDYDESDNTIILSMRHQDWIVKIKKGTGKIIWKLGYEGDVQLLSGMWFSGQHAPELQTDGSILIYDNGNERENGNEGYSRAVKFKVFLENNTWKANQIWESNVTDHYTSSLGDADSLPNENILLCAGGHFDEDAPAQIIELDQTSKDKVWQLEMYDHKIYRSTRLKSIYGTELNLLSPAKNTEFKIGKKLDIKWHSTGLSGNLKIILKKSDGSGLLVINNSVASNKGTYKYTIPSDISHGRYYISIKNAKIEAQSNVFTITKAD